MTKGHINQPDRVGDVASFMEIGNIKILCPKAEDFVNVRKSIT